MNICIIGVGYVGLVTAACFSSLGHTVIGIESDIDKLKKLKKGFSTIYEPGIDKLIKEGLRKKKLFFFSDIEKGVEKCEVIFICVGTPPKDDGEPDLSHVEKVVRKIASSLRGYRLIVEKSTVPVNTWQWVKRTISLYNKHNSEFDVAVNPEFLREGNAVKDFLHPDRIVMGVENERSRDTLLKLYEKIKCPKLVTGLPTAEIIKHASNSFLATKISFINSVARLCEKVGADVNEVAQGMGYDKRIGKSFLKAGVGYGGFCFPKDLAAFIHMAEKNGCDLGILREVQKVNESQKKLLISKIKDALWVLKGKTVGILGLSFKPDTDDMRLAPSIDVINLLQKEGAAIKAYDPQAMSNAGKVLKNVKFCKDPYLTAKDSDCLVFLTEWKEFELLDMNRIRKVLKTPAIVDGRNIFDPEKMRKLGFVYGGMGR